MRGLGVRALWIVLATTAPAFAEDSLYDRLWPQVPNGTGLSLEDQLTDQLTTLGNTLGNHVGTLSRGEIGLQFDGRRRRAHVRLGTEEHEKYLVFALAADAHFTQGIAQITTRIDLGIAGHNIELELPEVEMAPAEFHGDRGVMIRLPLFKRSF